jgi:hypothetical protein
MLMLIGQKDVAQHPVRIMFEDVGMWVIDVYIYIYIYMYTDSLLHAASAQSYKDRDHCVDIYIYIDAFRPRLPKDIYIYVYFDDIYIHIIYMWGY